MADKFHENKQWKTAEHKQAQVDSNQSTSEGKRAIST